MKHVIILLTAILIAGTGCTQTNEKAGRDGDVRPEVLNVAEFRSAMATGEYLVVDVRTPREFASGHIPGSINIDWTADDHERLFAELPADRPLLLYCAMGGRSDQARDYLTGKGYKAQDLEDGIGAWKDAGLPVEQ